MPGLPDYGRMGRIEAADNHMKKLLSLCSAPVSVGLLSLAACCAFALSGCWGLQGGEYISLGYRPGIDYRLLDSGAEPQVFCLCPGAPYSHYYFDYGYVDIGKLYGLSKSPDEEELRCLAVEQGATLVLYWPGYEAYFLAKRHAAL